MDFKPDKNKQYDKNSAEIIRKSHRHVFVCLTPLLIAAVMGSFVSMAAQPDENTTQRTVESFLKKLDDNKITRIEVYYMSWNTFTRISITEDFLRDNHYDYKVIAMNRGISEAGKALREFKFEKSDWKSFDFRWGCVFYSDNEEVLRLFFPTAPMVAVNGAGYKATPELIKSLTQYLPVVAYKEMNDFIQKNWEPSWHIDSKQQMTPQDVNK